MQLVRFSPNRSRFEVSTGYDFLNERWRTALTTLEFMTSRNSKLRIQSGYDLENSRWRPLNARWTFAHPREVYLTLGTQYDLDNSKLRQGTFDLDWRVTPKNSATS